MNREAVEQILKKTTAKTEQLPAELASQRLLRANLLDLLDFCLKATERIEDAKISNSPVRVKSLLEALVEVRKDGSVLGQTLCIDPENEELQYDLLESIEAFTAFVGESMSSLPVLLPVVGREVAIA